MESYFLQTPNINMNLLEESEIITRSVYQFISRIERVSPYKSCVKFNLVESKAGEYMARLEVVANSFEILLTKKNASLETLLAEFDQAFDDRLKPWLEGRFSA